jgi:hypothetical protein
VLDRRGRRAATSVTNLDVHDIARSARTYGLGGVAIVTPIDAQRSIVERIVEYWREPEHAARTPGRRESLALVKAAADVDEARSLAAQGGPVVMLGTTARGGQHRKGFEQVRRELDDRPQVARLLLLGTGWGLAPELLDECDQVLEPVRGPTGYNHLSVRSAAAVILDRLLGRQSALNSSGRR